MVEADACMHPPSLAATQQQQASQESLVLGHRSPQLSPHHGYTGTMVVYAGLCHYCWRISCQAIKVKCNTTVNHILYFGTETTVVNHIVGLLSKTCFLVIWISIL
jgi:hypothetical protein